MKGIDRFWEENFDRMISYLLKELIFLLALPLSTGSVQKSLFVSDNLHTPIAIRPQEFGKCIHSSIFSLRVKCGCMFILWLNWKCFRDTKWLNVNMNDFREVSAKVYSQTAFRMLETEYMYDANHVTSTFGGSTSFWWCCCYCCSILLRILFEWFISHALALSLLCSLATFCIHTHISRGTLMR